MHEHAQTWSVLKTLYSSTGGTGTTSTSYAMSTVNPVIHASGTGNAEPAASKKIKEQGFLVIVEWKIEPSFFFLSIIVGVSLQSNLQGTMTLKSLSETGMAQNTVAEIQGESKCFMKCVFVGSSLFFPYSPGFFSQSIFLTQNLLL